MKIFFAENVTFEHHHRTISAEEIKNAIDDFPGHEHFIDFYIIYNGGEFTQNAFFYPCDSYEAARKYSPIEVASFFHISLYDDIEDTDDEEVCTFSIAEEKDRRLIASEKFEDFNLFNIPFANNHGDNSFWIHIQTGEVRYMDFGKSYDPNDAILVAPSFYDFCKQIRATRKSS